MPLTSWSISVTGIAAVSLENPWTRERLTLHTDESTTISVGVVFDPTGENDRNAFAWSRNLPMTSSLQVGSTVKATTPESH